MALEIVSRAQNLGYESPRRSGISQGDLDIIQWWWEPQDRSAFTNDMMGSAVVDGRLEIVCVMHWLTKHRSGQR